MPSLRCRSRERSAMTSSSVSMFFSSLVDGCGARRTDRALLQVRSQGSQSSMCSRLDGCRGAAQRGERGLVDREPLDVAQDDDRTLVERKLLDRFSKPLEAGDCPALRGRPPRPPRTPLPVASTDHATGRGPGSARLATRRLPGCPDDPPPPRRPGECHLDQVLSSPAIPTRPDNGPRCQLARGLADESLELTLVRATDHGHTCGRTSAIRPTPSKLRDGPEGFADPTPISDWPALTASGSGPGSPAGG